MASLFELFQQLMAIVAKSPTMLDKAIALLVFLRDNQQYIETALDWFTNLFSGPDGGPTAGAVPSELSAVSDELVALKKAQLAE